MCWIIETQGNGEQLTTTKQQTKADCDVCVGKQIKQNKKIAIGKLNYLAGTISENAVWATASTAVLVVVTKTFLLFSNIKHAHLFTHFACFVV